MTSYRKIARYLDAKREADVLKLQVIRLQKRGNEPAMAARSARRNSLERAQRRTRRAHAALTVSERAHVERVPWPSTWRAELDRRPSRWDERAPVPGTQMPLQ
jgi:hypothetical protein